MGRTGTMLGRSGDIVHFQELRMAAAFIASVAGGEIPAGMRTGRLFYQTAWTSPMKYPLNAIAAPLRAFGDISKWGHKSYEELGYCLFSPRCIQPDFRAIPLYFAQSLLFSMLGTPGHLFQLALSSLADRAAPSVWRRQWPVR